MNQPQKSNFYGTMQQARDSFYRDKKRADEIDNVGVYIAMYYSDSTMIVWERNYKQWTRVLYCDDKPVNTQTFV